VKQKLIAFILFILVGLILIFDHTSTLLMNPLVTPSSFLLGMPYVNMSLLDTQFVLIQPSSTIFVYLLGLLMIGLGIFFVLTKGTHKSRFLFGIGLILWGLGAIFAGTSYQAFGYELKCLGMDYCLFTSKFEFVYLLLTAYSINFILTAVAYLEKDELSRNRLIQFAMYHSLAYTIFLFIGVIIPSRFMVSYEGFMMFVGGEFVLMFVVNLKNHLQQKDFLNRNFVIVWILFFLVNVFYFIYLFSGVSETLYEVNHIWFNANDVLHILLMGWALAIYFLVGKQLKDYHLE